MFFGGWGVGGVGVNRYLLLIITLYPNKCKRGLYVEQVLIVRKRRRACRTYRVLSSSKSVN